MIAFVLIAALMVAVALAWVLVPLLRHRRAAPVDREVSNVALLRDQLRVGGVERHRVAVARRR